MPVRTEHRFPPGLTVPDAAGVARYRPATALPAGSLEARRRRPPSTGRNAPAILPNAPRKDDSHATHRCRGRKRGLLRP